MAVGDSLPGFALEVAAGNAKSLDLRIRFAEGESRALAISWVLLRIGSNCLYLAPSRNSITLPYYLWAEFFRGAAAGDNGALFKVPQKVNNVV